MIKEMATHHSPAPTMTTNTAVRGGGAEPIVLFEDSWFFGNLFDQASSPAARTMSRCFSDPCTSSRTTFIEEVPSSAGVAEASQAGHSVPVMEEAAGKRGKAGRTLTRQRSCKQRIMSGGGQCGGSRRSLVRTPSLPATVFGGGGEAVDDDGDDDESDVRMSHLIRTAFAQSSKSSVTPPRSNNRPPRKNTGHESNNPTPIPSSKESSTNPRLSPNSNPNPNPLMKSVSNLETLFSQSSLICPPDSNLNRVGLSRDALGSKAPPSCLPANESGDHHHHQKGLIRRTQSTKVSSEDLAAASASAATVRKWVRSDNSADDLKAQIKLWARNVATNVRQEC